MDVVKIRHRRSGIPRQTGKLSRVPLPVPPLHHFADRAVVPAGAVFRRYTILVQLGSDRAANQTGSPEVDDLADRLDFHRYGDHAVSVAGLGWARCQTIGFWLGFSPCTDNR